MNDLNFFSILKKQKSKNKTLKIIGATILVVLLLVNAVFVFLAYMKTNELNDRIEKNQNFLASEDTKNKVKEANVLNKEVTIAQEYLGILEKVSGNFTENNKIKVELIDHIRELAPIATKFTDSSFEEDTIILNCFTNDVADPMNYYNTLLNDERFSKVVLPGFEIDFEGTVTYSVILTLKGGSVA